MATIPWNITPGGPFNFFGMTMVVCEIDTKDIGGGDSAGNITLPKYFVPESILPFIGGSAIAVAIPKKVTVSGKTGEFDVEIVASQPSTEFTGVKAVESSGSFTYYMWDSTAQTPAAASVTATVTKYGDWVIEPTLSGAIGIVKIRILGHY